MNNADIEKLETSLKLAFKEQRFGDADSIFSELKKIDPNNQLGKRIMDKITEQKQDSLKKERSMHLSNLESEIKDVFKANKMDKIPSILQEIKKIDPTNSTAKKIEEKLRLEKIKLLSQEIPNLIEAGNWEILKGKANELLSLEWNHKIALEGLKAMGEARKVDWNQLVTVKAPLEKPSFFSRLFGSKPNEGHVEKEVVKPIEPLAQNHIKLSETPLPNNTQPEEVIKSEASPAPAIMKVVSLKPEINTIKPTEATIKPIEASIDEKNLKPAPAPTSISSENSGNIFTNLFGKKEEAKKGGQSIIDTIIAKKEEDSVSKKEVKKPKDETGEQFLKYNQALWRFATAFIILSAGFFYAFNIDQENRALALFGQDNYAVQLKAAADGLQAKKTEEININKEINQYQKGYENQDRATIDKITDGRLDWAQLIQKLNEVTESVYEKNSLAQYVQYNNFSYNVESGQLTVSATLSDPLGKNLTKLAELEEAFLYYPGNKNNAENNIEPYFYNLQEFQSYSKSFNKNTGRFVSDFSLSLSTKEKKSTNTQ